MLKVLFIKSWYLRLQIIRRIGLGPVFKHPEIQVWSCCSAGGSNVPDHIALLHVCLILSGEVLQMRVDGQYPAAVLKDHIVAEDLVEARIIFFDSRTNTQQKLSGAAEVSFDETLLEAELSYVSYYYGYSIMSMTWSADLVPNLIVSCFISPP